MNHELLSFGCTFFNCCLSIAFLLATDISFNMASDHNKKKTCTHSHTQTPLNERKREKDRQIKKELEEESSVSNRKQSNNKAY